MRISSFCKPAHWEVEIVHFGFHDEWMMIAVSAATAERICFTELRCRDLVSASGLTALAVI